MKCYEKENVSPFWGETFSFEQFFDISTMRYSSYIGLPLIDEKSIVDGLSYTVMALRHTHPGSTWRSSVDC